MRPVIIRPDQRHRFSWGNGIVTMCFEARPDHPVHLVGLSGRGMAAASVEDTPQRNARPIVELLATESGSHDNRLPLTETVAGRALRFVKAETFTVDASDTACDRHSDAAESATGTDRTSSMPMCRLEITQVASFDDLKPRGRDFGDGGTDDTTPAHDATDNDAPDIVTSSVHAGGDASDGGRPTPTEPVHGVTVVSVFETFHGLSAVRAYTQISATAPYPIEAVSSLNLTLPMDVNGGDADHTTVLWGDSAWAVENDWHAAPLRETVLRDRSFAINPGISSSRFVRSSTSTWSTGRHQPAGVLEVRTANVSQSEKVCPAERSRWTDSSTEPAFSVMWQIEHNGPWEWEVSEDAPGLHLTCFGPEYEDHQWFDSLADDHGFTSVPVSFAITAGDWQQAVAEMTLQRRALRRAKAAELGRTAAFERIRSLVVYNDYMNTLFGDPRLDKELPLIEGAAKLGADIFCIDAGWYDSTDGGWWDMVGEWAPSTNRFGREGLAGLAHTVREHGMGLGLWLEPEVIGVRSPLAATLPDDAFFRRHGVRVSDSGRYLLDFRSPAAREHVTRTVDRLIDEFDVRFFKFDYNTIPGTGCDAKAESVGGALLDHCRAYLGWLDDLRRRHPDVMIENCGSGAMRADYAQLERLDLQSTSDQCDPLVYAAIAAGAGMTIPPEQQGNWGYAQQEMDDETAALTLATGVLGRLYLSGFVDRMDETRMGLVRDAIALHRRVLAEQEMLVPWWPTGLPGFTDDWLASGLRPAPGSELGHGYLTVWRRGGATTIDIPLDAGMRLEQVFPDPCHASDALPWRLEAIKGGIRITATDTGRPSARIFRVV